MATRVKYRVHEVAKDFKVTSKVITEILTKYATTPKNHMQVLESGELDVIFEYLTQHHQMASIADVFADTRKPEAKPRAESQKADAPRRVTRRRRRPSSPGPRSKRGSLTPPASP